MNRTSLNVFVFLILTFAVGCATVGQDFTFSGPSEIKIGVTKKSEIVDKFGEPFRVGFDNGNLKWTYGFYKYRLFSDSDTKDLAITFDRDGVVKSYTFSTSMHDEKETLSHVPAQPE